MKNWEIIIPALNEEKFLPVLLNSIKAQNFKNCSVTLVDSNSDDKTIEVAKNFGCKVLNGKRGNPGINRNIGAKNSKAKYIIFLDADSYLPKDFLKINTQYFLNKKLDVAGARIWPLSKNPLDWFFQGIMNITTFVMQFFNPATGGACILVKRNVHNKNNFDETITFCEDAEYTKRAVKNGNKFGFLKKGIYVSMRRFEKKGRIMTGIEYVKLNAHRFFIGELRKDINYEFGKF